MNLFLPEETITESMRALDDARLNSQIRECKTILSVALTKRENGYGRHPVCKYYKDYSYFVCKVACLACMEYRYRKGIKHEYNDYFLRESMVLEIQDDAKPFYCEGLITDTNHIRTTENTVELFRAKLCKKWDNDKYPPKWTNREPPEWYHSNR